VSSNRTDESFQSKDDENLTIPTGLSRSFYYNDSVIVFSLGTPLLISGDCMLRLRHVRLSDGVLVPVFRAAFHTDFVPDAFHLTSHDLDWDTRLSDAVIPSELTMDVFLSHIQKHEEFDKTEYIYRRASELAKSTERIKIEEESMAIKREELRAKVNAFKAISTVPIEASQQSQATKYFNVGKPSNIQTPNTSENGALPPDEDVDVWDDPWVDEFFILECEISKDRRSYRDTNKSVSPTAGNVVSDVEVPLKHERHYEQREDSPVEIVPLLEEYVPSKLSDWTA